jgi:hypothetical protein
MVTCGIDSGIDYENLINNLNDIENILNIDFCILSNLKDDLEKIRSLDVSSSSLDYVDFNIQQDLIRSAAQIDDMNYKLEEEKSEKVKLHRQVTELKNQLEINQKDSD